MIGYARLALMALALWGCTQQAINIDRAQLMPEAVARSVVERHMGPAWATSPFVLGCDKQRIPITFRDIRSLEYFADKMDCCHHPQLRIQNYPGDFPNCRTDGSYAVYEVSQSVAEEIILALVSLGAPVTTYYYFPTGLSSRPADPVLARLRRASAAEPAQP